MIVAVSTYYRKSAGLSLAAEVARLAIPHMMMPQPGSPENFMSMLGGVLPPNFSEIPQQDRARLEKGNRYAAQRGLLRDELSGLFKSMGRDYMAGLKELIMTLYDCPTLSRQQHQQQRAGRHPRCGALHPGRGNSRQNWQRPYLRQTGSTATSPASACSRQRRITRERKAVTESQAPTDLANRLKRLHERLPEPPLPDALGREEIQRSVVAGRRHLAAHVCLRTGAASDDRAQLGAG